MKKILRTFLLLGFVFLCGTLSAQRPHYWTWSHYEADRDWDKYFKEMTDVGIKGLILQASPERMQEIIPVADKYGVTVYAWMWIMNNRPIAKEHPEWLDYNRRGQSLRDHKAYVEYYQFLSPIIQGVRDGIARQVEQMTVVEGLKGISMDYCRYVDQILPTSLWANYGIVQDKEYPEWDYGYHPAMLAAFEQRYGYNPAMLEDPAKDSVWFQFRLDQVNEVANMVALIAHENGMASSASPFPTPEMSRRMVRQDWAQWNLDVAFPMIYNGFYNGDSTWIASCVSDCIRDTKKRGTAIYCGLHLPDFSPKRLAETPGAPTLTQAMAAAVTAGARGVAIFTFESLSAAQRAEMKTFIEKHPAPGTNNQNL